MYCFYFSQYYITIGQEVTKQVKTTIMINYHFSALTLTLGMPIFISITISSINGIYETSIFTWILFYYLKIDTNIYNYQTYLTYFGPPRGSVGRASTPRLCRAKSPGYNSIRLISTVNIFLHYFTHLILSIKSP